MWTMRVVSVVSTSALLAMTWVSGCGSATRAKGNAGTGGDDAHAGVGGSGSDAGSAATSAGGSDDSGGTGASAPSGGSQSATAAGAAGETSSGGESGAAACVPGGSCDCERGLGTGQCTEDGSTCSCPPPECQSERVDCFEPCGGDPFGNWLLEDGCDPGGELGNACEGGSIRATIRQRTLRIQFADWGVLKITGRAEWELAATAPPACLGVSSVESCGTGVAWASPLLFASDRTLLAGCTENACGSCDCFGTASGEAPPRGAWSHAGTQLTLGDRTVPYCVDGDVLWMGGPNADGERKVAYKFRKLSCARTTLPCEERTRAECESTDDCMLGRCLPTGGDATKCSGVFQSEFCTAPDCTWVTDECGSSGLPSCPFDTCELTPACTLGPPVARCTGAAWCGGTDATECSEPGCSIRTCSSGLNGDASCENLYVTECERAPGCSAFSAPDRCTGTTRCAAQTDDEVCERLGCTVREQCWGAPVRTCSELSVEECHTLPGCQIEW